MRESDDTVRAFHRAYYAEGEAGGTWNDTRWLGVRAQKCPLDLWVYQEIIHETRPDLIVETGTFMGGSALFMASVCEMEGRGRVVSIDVAPPSPPPRHPRAEFVAGSSIDPAIVARIAGEARNLARTMVVLDSEHGKGHVLAELAAYAPLVTPGCYLVVEDTNLNGNPVQPGCFPGPMEAVDEFLSRDGSFTRDRSREKFGLTFNPGGYLLKNPFADRSVP